MLATLDGRISLSAAVGWLLRETGCLLTNLSVLEIRTAVVGTLCRLHMVSSVIDGNVETAAVTDGLSPVNRELVQGVGKLLRSFLSEDDFAVPRLGVLRTAVAVAYKRYRIRLAMWQLFTKNRGLVGDVASLGISAATVLLEVGYAAAVLYPHADPQSCLNAIRCLSRGVGSALGSFGFDTTGTPGFRRDAIPLLCCVGGFAVVRCIIEPELASRSMRMALWLLSATRFNIAAVTTSSKKRVERHSRVSGSQPNSRSSTPRPPRERSSSIGSRTPRDRSQAAPTRRSASVAQESQRHPSRQVFVAGPLTTRVFCHLVTTGLVTMPLWFISAELLKAAMERSVVVGHGELVGAGQYFGSIMGATFALLKQDWSTLLAASSAAITAAAPSRFLCLAVVVSAAVDAATNTVTLVE